MKRIIRLTYNKLGISSERTRNITKHVGVSFFLKGGSIVSNFLLVPLTIDFLDNENYGVWLTISSFIAWFSFFDIGLGNGLRNKFAEAKALNDDHLAQAYVSSAYFTIGAISLFVLGVFYCINPLINWSNVFNTSENIQGDLKVLMLVVFTFFCLQLIVKLISTIYAADQHHSIHGKIQFLTQVISLIVIWILTKTTSSSLLLFGSIFSSLPVVLLFCLNIFAFNSTYKNYKPKFNLWKVKYLKGILGLGINFFVIQIASLVLFSTDNFIITRLFSPSEVVPYNIAHKYFSLLIMAYTIMVTPYWSSFTEAYARQEIQWIKNSVKNVQKLWLLIPIGLIMMIFISDWFYYLWVGNKVTVPIQLSLGMALFVLLSTFNMIYVYFINGVGKIKLQLVTSIISMIINIPLSIFLAKTLNMGITGVILATCFSLSYSAILRPMQYFKIINQKAKGIWNK